MKESNVTAFGIIASAGDARSFAMEAIQTAHDGDITQARELLRLGKAAIHPAHQLQTEMIFKECQGEDSAVNILMVHAQDHLMTSMLLLDLSEHYIHLYERTNNAGRT